MKIVTDPWGQWDRLFEWAADFNNQTKVPMESVEWDMVANKVRITRLGETHWVPTERWQLWRNQIWLGIDSMMDLRKGK